MDKMAVLMIGPPGSGKGTQANLLAEHFGFHHFEISEIIERNFNSADPANERIIKAKESWLKGELVDPELVARWTIHEMRAVKQSGKSLITSGNPRTIFEAEEETPILNDLYGKENIKVVHVNLSKEESIRRNSRRRICQANRHPIPDFPEYENMSSCPKDGSPLITRVLDTPETIGIRYEVYLRRTQPIISFMQTAGYEVLEIKGDQPINKVHEDIIKALKLKEIKHDYQNV